MGECGWENRFILGLAGTPGSGKSTVARILEEERGYRRLSFGTRLKETACLVYGLEGEERRYVWGTQEDKEEIIPRLGISGRFILQRLGTEVCRTIHPDTWIMAVWEEIKKDQEHRRFVLDDVRFQNELEFIKPWGKVWRIERQEIDQQEKEGILQRFLPGWARGKWKTHIAERPDLLKGVDLRLANNLSLGILRNKILVLEQEAREERGLRNSETVSKAGD